MPWLEAAPADAITPGKATIVTMGGKEVGLFCEGERYYAVLNFCPHLGAPICAGKVFAGCATAPGGPGEPLGFDPERRILRCPWHHWEFDLATGEALVPIRQRLKTYPVRIEDEKVWIEL
jgi:nitrite reductase/ring-hydroxylating ferredoxin subunit